MHILHFLLCGAMVVMLFTAFAKSSLQVLYSICFLIYFVLIFIYVKYHFVLKLESSAKADQYSNNFVNTYDRKEEFAGYIT